MVRCRSCGARYSEYGDGWDGECPTCADKTYEKERETQ
jgi:DNA-directed RNA polymerase subunit RPC12/RpoP